MVGTISIAIDLLDTFLIVVKVVLGILAVTMGFGIISYFMEDVNIVISWLSLAVVLSVMIHAGRAWLVKTFKPMTFHRKMKKMRKRYEAKYRVQQEILWFESIHAWVEDRRGMRSKPLF